MWIRPPGTNAPSARRMNGFHEGNEAKSVSARHTRFGEASISTVERSSLMAPR